MSGTIPRWVDYIKQLVVLAPRSKQERKPLSTISLWLLSLFLLEFLLLFSCDELLLSGNVSEINSSPQVALVFLFYHSDREYPGTASLVFPVPRLVS